MPLTYSGIIDAYTIQKDLHHISESILHNNENIVEYVECDHS
jgi:hypothetical protein